jgi:phage baseplate assembly protein W
MARKSQISTPKLAFPFRFAGAGTHAATVEQGSDEEIISCVEVLLRTPVGSRIEVPDYGINDYVFRQGGVALPEVESSIGFWEPRATTQLSLGDIEGVTQRVRIHYLEHPNG